VFVGISGFHLSALTSHALVPDEQHPFKPRDNHFGSLLNAFAISRAQAALYCLTCAGVLFPWTIVTVTLGVSGLLIICSLFVQ
jgi:hypothetical protein